MPTHLIIWSRVYYACRTENSCRAIFSCRVKTVAEVKIGAEQKIVAEQELVAERYSKDLVAELSRTQYVPSISTVSWAEQCSISACKFVTLQTLM